MPRKHPRPEGRTEKKSLDEMSGRVLGPQWARVGGFMVSETTGQKRYKCPYCQGWVEPGTRHIVAYPHGRLDDRRHYHSGCWRRTASGKTGG